MACFEHSPTCQARLHPLGLHGPPPSHREHAPCALSSRLCPSLRPGRGGIAPPSTASIADASPARLRRRTRNLALCARHSPLQSWLWPARRTCVIPAQSATRRATAPASGGSWAGRVVAFPAQLTAWAAEPAPQGHMCSLRPAWARRLLAPLRPSNGRARRPLNGPAAPPAGFGRRLRRPRVHHRTSGEGRDGRAG